MTRLLALVLLIAGVCAGCATSRHSEADTLVSDIVHHQSSQVVCPVGDLRVCAADEGDDLRCECADHRSVFGGR